MASVTAIAKADPAEVGRWRRILGSRLGRLLIGLNLLGLVILVVGALVLNETRRGLVEARIEALSVQGELIASLMADVATRGAPTPAIEPGSAALVLQDRFIPRGQRARLFDSHGDLIADSYTVSDAVYVDPLPPARKRQNARRDGAEDAEDAVRAEKARTALAEEVREALTGRTVTTLRRNETGERVVSVSIPVQRVQAVLGVLTLEAGDLDEIIAAQRLALAPFAVVALLVTLLSYVMLHVFVVRPILRLSATADRVRTSQARSFDLPDLERRDDEIGDLARSLQTMTRALAERMDAIERFAADVSHEIKNPLTSIRSAVETLDLVKDDKARDRLNALLKQDVGRLDRLITDISNASRLDAELSRERPRPVDMKALLAELAKLYEASRKPGEPKVKFAVEGTGPFAVEGREGPLGQVFRNVIDNARSFSPPERSVRISLSRESGAGRPIIIRIDDDGPGVPAENLETVFERFYTSRPRGAAFGANSGLGLSIARQIVETHGGRIWAENRTGADGTVAGARFVVALPEAGS